MARGLAVHKAVEYNMEQKVTSHEDVPVGDMLDAFSTSWDDLSAEGLRDDEEKDAGEVKDGGIALTRLHHTEVSPTIQPIWVEKPVQFDINGVTYSGQIDLADEMGRIRDTKTTKNRPKPESYLFGMTGYAIAARQLTGEEETDVILDYVVATKTPYYLPVSNGGPVHVADIVRFANTIDVVAQSIEAGRFVPNGIASIGTCEYMCGYRDICPYYMGKK